MICDKNKRIRELEEQITYLVGQLIDAHLKSGVPDDWSYYNIVTTLPHKCRELLRKRMR